MLTRHRTRAVEPKIVERCDLPLTAPRAASVIVTELGLFQVTPEGLVLRERARSVSVEDVRALTPCPVDTDGPVAVLEDALEQGRAGTTGLAPEGGRA